jgi:flagellar biosynthesis/type III secretory pathway protein FliH
VVKVTKLDYTFDRQLTLEREDARAEGKAEGKAEGQAKERESAIRTMLKLLQELEQPRKEGFKQLADKYQIQGEQAEDYMKKYWS